MVIDCEAIWPTTYDLPFWNLKSERTFKDWVSYESDVIPWLVMIKIALLTIWVKSLMACSEVNALASNLTLTRAISGNPEDVPSPETTILLC